MSPVALTCVPPHSSRLKPGTLTTRTLSPYFSPNSAIAPGLDRFLRRAHLGRHRRVAVDLRVDDPLDAVDLLARHRLKVHEVEAQPIGRDQRSRLLHVRAEHLAQRRVQQMRRRVVAPRRIANLGVDFGGDDVADAQLPGGDADAVGARQARPDAREPFDRRRRRRSPR